MADESNPLVDAPNPFWRRHSALVMVLTAVWAAVSFLPPLLMGRLHLSVLGMPLAMLFMAELVPLVFVAIAWAYARRADALDADHANSGP